jgi:trigger factor
MQVSLEVTSALERKLTINVESTKVDDAALKKMKELAKTQRINGFRPGKIPLRVIKKRFGQHVRQDIISEVIQTSFYDAIKQEKITPAGVPKIQPISLDEGQSLEFVAIFDVFPTITLQDFSQITLEKKSSEVTNDDINEMLETLREQQAIWNDVERVAKKGDQLVIDFSGEINGEAFDGSEMSNFELILGEGRLLPDFEEQLINTKVNTEFSIFVTFPNDYQKKNLQNKEANFSIKVHSIKEKECLTIEALSDKLAISGGLEQLKKDVQKNMQRESKRTIQQHLKNQITEALLEKHQFDIPRNLIEQEVEQQKNETLKQFTGKGTQLPELPNDLFTEQATKRVKLSLIVSEIIKEHKIQAENKEIESKIEDLASIYEKPDEFVAYYLSNEERLNEIEQLVLEDNVLKFIESKAQVNSVSIPFSELMNPKNETKDDTNISA